MECHNFIGVTIPKCLLCDVPKSCKLHRLSKFHSLTKNHRYPQVMIHDVPPLATLLQSLPVVKICDLDSPSHALFLEAQKYSDALKSYSRALENLKPFAGDDAWHRVFVKQILESSKKPVGFYLLVHQRSTLKSLARSTPHTAVFVPEIYFWSWQSPGILELAFFVFRCNKKRWFQTSGTHRGSVAPNLRYDSQTKHLGEFEPGEQSSHAMGLFWWKDSLGVACFFPKEMVHWVLP